MHGVIEILPSWFVTVVMAATLLFLPLLLALCSAADLPSVRLMNAAKDGLMMPVAGIGTWGYGLPGEVWNDDIAEKAVGQWLALGGRRIDGSKGYGDQVGVGKAVKASGVKREEIFMTSKVSPAEYNSTLQQMDEVLSDLQMDYVDLLLIHWPGSRISTKSSNTKIRQSCWKALEYLYNNGKAHAIGVSNFEADHIQDIVDLKGLLPSVNQVEYHPFWHEDDLVEYCKKMNITFNSYSPLGAPDWGPPTHGWDHSLLQEPTILQIAEAHQCTPAQVVLQWEWQQGVIVNPRTEKEYHMIENLSFFDIQLTDDEIRDITAITPPINRKVCADPQYQK